MKPENQPTITENQLLWLSGIISNKASVLTDLPITESEDCRLAIMLGQWLRDLGVSVEESEDGEEKPFDFEPEEEETPGFEVFIRQKLLNELASLHQFEKGVFIETVAVRKMIEKFSI